MAWPRIAPRDAPADRKRRLYIRPLAAVSPVRAVDAFEWKAATVDAIGRGDTRSSSRDRPVSFRRVRRKSPRRLPLAEPPRRTAIVEWAGSKPRCLSLRPPRGRSRLSAGERQAPRCTCRSSADDPASCRPILTKARPRSAFAGAAKSAEGTWSARRRLASISQWH